MNAISVLEYTIIILKLWSFNHEYASCLCSGSLSSFFYQISSFSLCVHENYVYLTFSSDVMSYCTPKNGLMLFFDYLFT